MANVRPAPLPSASNIRSPLAPWIAAWLIAVGVALAYHNTLGVPFLFDDNSSIKDNPTIRNLLRAWWPPTDGGLTVSGRPLLNFSLALNYAVSGTAVWSYHLLNLLIHFAAGATLFGIVRSTLLRPIMAGRFGRDASLLALAVALLWALHPLQTESVTYIVQRAESLVGLCYLLTLWCFIRAVEPGAAKFWAPAAIVACLLGMATKEVMVTAPVVVAFYDRVFVAASWREVWGRRGRFHLALAATWLLLAALVWSTGNRGGTAGLGSEVTPLAYALTQAGAVLHYLRLAVWPSPLVFDYGNGLAGGWGDVWWQVLLVGLLASGSLLALGRSRPAGYAAAFFFVVLAPSSSVVPVVTQTMAEHRTYLALAGVSALLVTSLYAVLGRRSFGVFVVVALAFTALTVRRNQDYRSELDLWEDTAVKFPRNARAFSTLGTIHQRENRLDAALAAQQTALRIAPTTEAWNNLGNTWMKLGNWSEAGRCFEEALRLKPGQSLVLNNLGNARLEQGRVPEAIRYFEEALRLNPAMTDTRYNLANLLSQHGRPADAVSHYEIYLRARADDAEARSNYGQVLQLLDRPTEALVQLETAVRLRPGNAQMHNNLGSALAQAGRLAEALRHFREAVRLDPESIPARENAARAARELGGG